MGARLGSKLLGCFRKVRRRGRDRAAQRVHVTRTLPGEVGGEKERLYDGHADNDPIPRASSN